MDRVEKAMIRVAKELGVDAIIPNDKQLVTFIAGRYISGDPWIKARIDKLVKVEIQSGVKLPQESITKRTDIH